MSDTARENNPAAMLKARSAARPTGNGWTYEGAAVAVCVIIALMAAPMVDQSYRFLSIAISTGIATIALYGLAVLFGQTGLLSMAHAALMGVGAYVAALLAVRLGLGFWAAIPFAMVASAIVAGILGLSSLRVAGHHFIIVTFAFGALFSIIMTNGGDLTGAAAGLDLPPIGTLMGIDLDKSRTSTTSL